MANLLDLQAERARIKLQISAKQRVINTLNSKISRLNTVKKEIEAIKRSLDTAKGRAKYKTFLSGDKNNWKGAKDDAFKDAVSGTGGVEKSYKKYYDEVDDLLDSLVDAITNLKNQKAREEGILSNLKSLLNTIVGEIEKIFN